MLQSRKCIKNAFLALRHQSKVVGRPDQVVRDFPTEKKLLVPFLPIEKNLLPTPSFASFFVSSTLFFLRDNLPDI